VKTKIELGVADLKKSALELLKARVHWLGHERVARELGVSRPLIYAVLDGRLSDALTDRIHTVYGGKPSVSPSPDGGAL
jgi:hypothetical protein